MIPFKLFYDTYIIRRIELKRYSEARDLIHGYSLACDLTDNQEKKYSREAQEADEKIFQTQMDKVKESNKHSTEA